MVMLTLLDLPESLERSTDTTAHVQPSIFPQSGDDLAAFHVEIIHIIHTLSTWCGECNSLGHSATVGYGVGESLSSRAQTKTPAVPASPTTNGSSEGKARGRGFVLRRNSVGVFYSALSNDGDDAPLLWVGALGTLSEEDHNKHSLEWYNFLGEFPSVTFQSQWSVSFFCTRLDVIGISARIGCG